MDKPRHTPDLGELDRQMGERPIDPLRLAIARENLIALIASDKWSAPEQVDRAVYLADALLAALKGRA